MDFLHDFGLINSLFENVIIFNPDRSVICKGSSIARILAGHGIYPDLLETLTDSDSGYLKELEPSVTACLHNGIPASFKFSNLPEEYVIFLTPNGESPHVIFGLKEKITGITGMERKLNARVHELQCLYNVSKELDAAASIPEALEKCIPHVKQGFLIPENTFVTIAIGGTVYGGSNLDIIGIKNILSCDLKSEEKKVGEIRVYLKHHHGFLNEQYNLVEEIANEISRALEKDAKERDLKKQQKILKAKNDTLLRLTDECHRSQQKLRTFFRAITDTIIVIDADYNIILANKDEIGDSGKCYAKLFQHTEPCPGCPARDTFATTGNCAQEREHDGKILSIRTYPIFDKDKNVDRVLEVCGDITNQKKMEDQLLQSSKLASLGKLVAGVAHEINNPNTFILGNLQIFNEALPDIFPILEEHYATHPELRIARLKYPDFRENISILVQDMLTGANRTKKIVEDLKNFAKKDDGVQKELVDINAIITNNLTLTQKHIKKFARLEVSLSEALPPVYGNPTKLEQVLLNLIMNASEAINHSEGSIHISTSYNPIAQQIEMCIRDNGCGMSDDTIKNIFDPFFTTKRSSGGTGLGLSITYGIIKDHDGTIDVQSKPGEGTSFIIRLPAITREQHG